MEVPPTFRKRKQLGSSPPKKSNGIIALLDLPSKTHVAIDGIHQIIQRDDFVGVSHVPNHQFHLIILRPSSEFHPNKGTMSNHGNISPSMGLIVFQNDDNTKNNPWIVARRYDPFTEEISSQKESVDHVTCLNLIRAVNTNAIPANRVVPYSIFLQGSTPSSSTAASFAGVPLEDTLQNWEGLTSFITPQLLKKRNLKHGEKVVPGCYEDDSIPLHDRKESSNPPPTQNDTHIERTHDGVEVQYPPIPCISNMKDKRLFFKSQHFGTTKYLENLTPSERTSLYLQRNSGTTYPILDHILLQYYNAKWQHLMGDLQLSFLLFLQLGCLSSLTHWRDLLSMLSLAPNSNHHHHHRFSNPPEEELNDVQHHPPWIPNFYSSLMDILVLQLQSIDIDFFQEVEYSQGNFFIPAVRRLLNICSHSWFWNHHGIQIKIKGLVTLVKQRFQIDISNISKYDTTAVEDDKDDDDSEDESHGESRKDENDVEMEDTKKSTLPLENNRLVLEDESDDEDGPVIVSMEEYDASMSRLSKDLTLQESPQQHISYSTYIRSSYPLLFAAMAPNEDVMMTCARILDDKLDVSLVREAAAYLENVEAKISY